MFSQVNDQNYKETIAATEQGVIICIKKLCPHCKNMEKVLEKFVTQRPTVAIFTLDFEDEAEAAAELKAERAPTLAIIKGGKVVATKTGLMNPREFTALYDASK